MVSHYNNKKGFTLVEILVVMAIIGLLASILVVGLTQARRKGRDAKRLMDMHTVIKALELYYDKYGYYPDIHPHGCGQWDAPGDGDFIVPLQEEKLISGEILDPTDNYNCGNYLYRKYRAGQNDCKASRGDYYVLGIVDMESVSGIDPTSPGFFCPKYDWQDDMEWVTGRFEN